MTLDGVWEAGEVWGFILQDFFNAFALGPGDLDSIDLV